MPRWTKPPAIVAEALIGVPDPLLTALHPGSPASPAEVASSLARSLAPAEHCDPSPSWLLPEQARSFRQVLAAVRRHGGAVLADPVGSGKTFVALAIAATMNRGSTACLVPAALLDQWKQAADRVGVGLALCSHEQLSRGKLPQTSRGLVIIDESHHFRNPQTKRYSHLAPWLVGQRALLITATPIVNRLADLAHQLLLAVRDNALAMDGTVSIRKLMETGVPAPALGRLVIESEPVARHSPRRVHRFSRPTAAECADIERLTHMLSQLALSQREPIAALIRGVLLRAAGSSPAALVGALRRYRRLLFHARDGLGAGCRLDRSELRRFTGDLGDQLIWWELLPSAEEGGSEIELEDLPQLEELIRATDAAARNGDGKLARLRDLLADGIPTLVFTISRDTVRYIRDQLSDLRPAWCTGDCAGIGGTTLPRHGVLDWFRQPTTSSLAPRHFIVTEVAAEGLNLQRAARVVHYDLPWTPTRLEQREGRSARYGSQHSQIEVIRFCPPPVLERLLHLETTLALKAKLPATAGLGPHGRHVWRWRAAMAERFGRSDARAGVAAVDSTREGLLAGFTLFPAGNPECLCATVLWLQPDGNWTEDPEAIATWLTVAAAQHETMGVARDRLTNWLSRLAVPIRERLALTRSRRWVTPDPTPAARRLADRLQRLVRESARRHHADRLTQLEQALAFVAGGHTAGEMMLVERLAGATGAQLAAAVGKLPKVPRPPESIEVRLTGLVLFGRAVASFSACSDFVPLSSTSMEP